MARTATTPKIQLDNSELENSDSTFNSGVERRRCFAPDEL